MTVLSQKDKEKIKRAVPKTSNKIIDATVIRLYIAYPDANTWTFTGLTGAIVFVNDIIGNTYFLKLVDIIGNRGVIWDQELYIDFQYNQDRSFFHSFEIEECLVGFLFESDADAAHFMKRIRQREKYATKETLQNKKAIALKKTAPPQAAPGPRGDPMNQRKRVQPLYYDVEPPEEWRALYKELADFGITEDMIAENREFIKSYIREQGGPLVGLEPPIPRRHQTHNNNANEPAQISHSTSRKDKAPPPPPPPGNASTPSSVSHAPPPPPAPPVTSSAPPAPPAPEQKQESSPVVEQPAPPKRNAPPAMPFIGQLINQQQNLPTPPPRNGPPSMPQVNNLQNRPVPAPPQLPPRLPMRDGDVPQFGVPQFGTPQNGPPLPPQRRAVPTMGGPPPPPPPRASVPSPTVSSGFVPPPPPPRAQNAMPPALPQKASPQQMFAPPLPPALPPVQNNTHSFPQSTSSYSPVPPPLPPTAPPSLPPVTSSIPVSAPPQLPPAPPAIPHTAPPELPQMAPPQLPQMAPPQLPQMAPPQLPQMAPPQLPQMAPPQLPQMAPPSLPQAAPPQLPQMKPPQIPSAPFPSSQAPPAPPPLPPTSSAPPAPPPPPAFSAPPPAPPMPVSSGPPAPPPPPPTSGPTTAAPPLPTPDGGRDALLASIQSAGGLKALKKVDKSQLDRPTVLLQEAKGEAPKTTSGAPGQPTSLADALSAALNQRKNKVSRSDDEESDDDW